MCLQAQRYAVAQFGGRVTPGAPACTAVPGRDGTANYLPSALASLLGMNEIAEPSVLAAKVAATCEANPYRFAKPQVREIVGSRVKSYPERIDQYRRQVDAALESDRSMPVLVRYCSNVLLSRNSTGIDPEDGKFDSDLCNEGGNPNDHHWHASTIIGRRCTHSGREYLLKNTWGPSCRGYDSDHQCDGGKLWIRGADLFRNTSSITLLE